MDHAINKAAQMPQDEKQSPQLFSSVFLVWETSSSSSDAAPAVIQVPGWDEALVHSLEFTHEMVS